MPSTIPLMTMKERARAPNYSDQALDAIVQIHAATDPPELLERLINATASIGASASLYSAAIPEGGHEPSCFSLFASHPDYAHAQECLGPMLSHPWFHFARTHTMPGTDRQIRIKKSEDAAAIELARGYGFRSCFIVPTLAGARLDRLEILCMGSDEADGFEGGEARLVRALAKSLAAELHDWLTRYLQQRLRAAARLVETDVGLLNMVWQGLGTKEISQLTGMTTASVDSRLQRINIRLHCARREESAVRAAAYGLLEST